MTKKSQERMTKEQIRQGLAESPIEPFFKEKADFIAWLRGLVSDKYAQMEETDSCFSANRDFFPIMGIGFPQKRTNLSLANMEIVKRLQHALGNAVGPCERCIRELNAAAHYQMQAHPELFTPSALKLADLDLRVRRTEHRREERGYKSDGLFLLQAKVPLMGGDPSMHDTHLVLYDEYSLRHGIHTFIDRVSKRPDLHEDLAQLTQFGDSHPFSFPRVDHRYHSATSQQYIRRTKGHLNTTIDIISRKFQ